MTSRARFLKLNLRPILKLITNTDLGSLSMAAPLEADHLNGFVTSTCSPSESDLLTLIQSLGLSVVTDADPVISNRRPFRIFRLHLSGVSQAEAQCLHRLGVTVEWNNRSSSGCLSNLIPLLFDYSQFLTHGGGLSDPDFVPLKYIQWKVVGVL